MTNYKGVIQDSVLGVVLATLIFDTHTHTALINMPM